MKGPIETTATRLVGRIPYERLLLFDYSTDVLRALPELEVTAVDGQPIRSPEDARFFHEKFSEYIKVSVPFVENEAVRHALEAMCRDALAKWAAQAEMK